MQPISLSLDLKDSLHLDSIQAYKDTYPSMPMAPHTSNPPLIRKYYAAWDPTDFIYTDGSQVTGKLVLGAAIIYPRTHTIIHTEIKTQKEWHTIN